MPVVFGPTLRRLAQRDETAESEPANDDTTAARASEAPLRPRVVLAALAVAVAGWFAVRRRRSGEGESASSGGRSP